MADFFEQLQPAAFLKHAILKGYLPVFVRKTGSRTAGGRVAYIDGYAGPGVYKDGSPGSPALAVEMAKMVAANRQVDGFFVEKDAAAYAALRQFIEAEQPGWRAEHGAVEDHLKSITGSIPDDRALFALLDPFGLGIPMAMLEEELLVRGGRMMTRRFRVGGAATEVLLNFSLPGLRRNAGHLDHHGSDPKYLKASRTIVEKIDATLGGDWWQAIWLSGAADREEQILQGYIDRLLHLRGGWGVFRVAVADRLDGPPSYYLLLLTQHEDGAWYFNDAVSSAAEKYRAHCHALAGQLPMPAPEAAWAQTIAGNIEGRLAKGPFKLAAELADVYRPLIGVARSKHVRKALEQLLAEGKTSTNPKGVKDLGQLRIRPA